MPTLKAKVGGVWTPVSSVGPVGPAGADGAPGPSAVSADAGNMAIISPTDSLIYVPASIARGKMAFAKITASQSGITAAVDITGLSVTWTADPARMYRTSAAVSVYTAVPGDVWKSYITDEANVSVSPCQFPDMQTDTVNLVWSVMESGLSGQITRKVRGGMAKGTGPIGVSAAPNQPSYILVEDIGPA